jgi:hypothetical protein
VSVFDGIKLVVNEILLKYFHLLLRLPSQFFTFCDVSFSLTRPFLSLFTSSSSFYFCESRDLEAFITYKIS